MPIIEFELRLIISERRRFERVIVILNIS
jgi:hypothetical protein